MKKTFKVYSVADLMNAKFPCLRGVLKTLKQYAATDLDAEPAYDFEGTEYRVSGLGEPLSEPIHWIGRQWAVTAYGVECRDGTYAIEASRLWENEKDHGWVMQVGNKTWTDPCDFAEALRIARHIHRGDQTDAFEDTSAGDVMGGT